MLFHIADAPCHGTKFHSFGSNEDSYPDGDPLGRSISSLFGQIRRKGIQYIFGKITTGTDVMLKRFSNLYGGEIVVFDTKDVGSIIESVVSAASIAVSQGINMSKIFSQGLIDTNYSVFCWFSH